MERHMFPMVRATAGLVASVALVVLAVPAVADPVDPIPGTGVFQVGTDIAPGLYSTGGSAAIWAMWVNNLPIEDSMCAWSTYSTPEVNEDSVVQANTSVGPMYVSIPATVKAFESQNCQPWTRVS